MANWVDAKAVAEELGIRAWTVRKLARVEGAPHRREGGRVYFDLDKFPQWYKKFVTTDKPRRSKDDSAQEAATDLDKIPQDQNYVLWNRGEWRGWAVAQIQWADPAFVRLLVDYAKNRLRFTTPEFRQDVARGKIFIVEPDATLEFLIIQLSRFGRTNAPKAAIKHLRQAIVELTAWREANEEEENNSS